MNREAPAAAEKRVFVALPLGEGVRNALAGLAGEARSALPGVRWVRPELLHLTLRFVGETPHWEEVAEAMRETAALTPPFDLELGGVGVFPERGSPRVLWVGLAGPGMGPLASLARRLEGAVRERGFRPERRPFSPHITVGRFRFDRRARGRLEAWLRGGGRAWVEAHLTGRPVRARRVALMESHLDRTGPTYEVLETASLEGDPPPDAVGAGGAEGR